MKMPLARTMMLFAPAAAAVLAADCARAGDRELGQYLSSECVTCHRNLGEGGGDIPQIAGLPEDQFIALMLTYKEKQRANPVMQTVAGRLSQEDIAALATYFGSLAQPTKNK
jgi:cytochrome c